MNPEQDQVSALIEEGRACEKCGDLDGAAHAYQAALAQLAESDPLRGELQLIVASVQRQKQIADEQDLLLGRAVVMMEQQQWRVAAECYRALIAQSPQSAHAGDWLAALRQCDSEIRLLALFEEADAAIRRGEWTAARELLRELIRQQPHYARAGITATALLERVSKANAPARPLRWILAIIATLALTAFGVAALGVYYINSPAYLASIATHTPTATPTSTPTSTSTATPNADATGFALTRIADRIAQQTATAFAATQTALAPTITPTPTPSRTPTITPTRSPTPRPTGNCEDKDATLAVENNAPIDPYFRPIGTANPVNFARYVIEVRMDGMARDAPHLSNWNVIFTGESPVNNGELMMWNTYTVPNGRFYFRLTVFLKGGTRLAECERVVYVGH
jgi:tetratricopeptide (TPR) repeat protein